METCVANAIAPQPHFFGSATKFGLLNAGGTIKSMQAMSLPGNGTGSDPQA
jgi:hypothetical protein